MFCAMRSARCAGVAARRARRPSDRVGDAAHKLLIPAEERIVSGAGRASTRVLWAGACPSSSSSTFACRNGFVCHRRFRRARLNALDNQADACIGNFDDLQDPADRSHLVQILLFGIGSTDLPLGHEEHLCARSAWRSSSARMEISRSASRLSVRLGKGGQPPQRQNGNVHSCRFHGVFTPF